MADEQTETKEAPANDPQAGLEDPLGGTPEGDAALDDKGGLEFKEDDKGADGETESKDDSKTDEAKPEDDDSAKMEDDILGSEDDEGGTAEADEETKESPYTDFTLKDGQEIDTEALGIFAPLLAKHKISQDDAQEFISAYSEMKSQEESADDKAFVERHNGWVAELKADPDFGGAHYAQTKSDARRAIAQLGGDGLRTAIKEAGLSANPDVVKAFARIGRQLGEATPAHSEHGKTRSRKLTYS